MNAVRKMAYLIEGAYKAFQKVTIHRKIESRTLLVIGFVFWLTCFFIPNNIGNAKSIYYPENIDPISMSCIMIVCLLFFVWFRGKKFNFERSLSMKLHGSKNVMRSMDKKKSTFNFKTLIFREAISKRSINEASKTRNPIHNPSNQNQTGSKIDLEPKQNTAESTLQLKNHHNKEVKSKKVTALGTLVAGIVHEINNPMTFVNTSIYNLRQDLEKFKTFLFDLAGEEVDNATLTAFKERFGPLFKHLDILDEGTNRIQEIVRNLKSFSQTNNMEMKKVNLQEIIEATLNLVKSSYKNQVDFITELKPGLEIQGNEGKLKQVFMNMIINACQAIMEKQEKSSENAKGALTIYTWEENQYVAIGFQDTGTGISREARKRMFEPFFTTKRGNKGTGLGLFISDKIVKEHGGKIEVQSKEGKGTTIILYFPLILREENILC